MSKNMSSNNENISESTSESDSTTRKNSEGLRGIKKQKLKDRDQTKDVIESSNGIVKPVGNYIDIPKTLKLSTEIYNSYKSNIRDLVEAYIDISISWEKQDRKLILKLIEKFKTINIQFPKSVGDWAIKLMIKRSINNKRAHKKKISNNEERHKLKEKRQVEEDNDEVEHHHKPKKIKGKTPIKQTEKEDESEEVAEITISDSEGRTSKSKKARHDEAEHYHKPKKTKGKTPVKQAEKEDESEVAEITISDSEGRTSKSKKARHDEAEHYHKPKKTKGKTPVKQAEKEDESEVAEITISDSEGPFRLFVSKSILGKNNDNPIILGRTSKLKKARQSDRISKKSYKNYKD